MLGFRYFKARPTDHVVIFRSGVARRQGLGLSGFVFVPFATASAIPVDARDELFAVEAATLDYQAITIQGLLSFRLTEPMAAAARQDFSIDLKSGRHIGEPMKQIAERLKAIAQTACRAALGVASLDAALNKSDELSRAIFETIGADGHLRQSGITVERVLVLAIKPAPDIKKALEARLREQLLREADAASFERRRAAIKEEHDLELRNEHNKRALAETELANEQALEVERKNLADARAATTAAEARAEASAQRERLKPWTEIPVQHVAALALRDWANRDTGLRSLSISNDAIDRIADLLHQDSR